MSVVVFGSANMDIVVRAPRWPTSGETIAGQSVGTTPGGKGANQAVAAARLGCRTAFVGRVGADPFGAALRESLIADGVDVSDLQTDSERETGVACIVVDDAADNRIIIVSGANGGVGDEDLARLAVRLRKATILLVQLELDLEIVTKALEEAARAGVRVIADPAPAPLGDLPEQFFRPHVVLTPNETEAQALVGYAVDTDESARAAALELTARGVGAVAIKLGSRGLCWSTGQVAQTVRAPRVDAVDTVGAGDAVNGALAAALSDGQPFGIAARWAVATGALSVTKPGAQPAMPTRDEMLACLDSMAAVETAQQR